MLWRELCDSHVRSCFESETPSLELVGQREQLLGTSTSARPLRANDVPRSCSPDSRDELSAQESSRFLHSLRYSRVPRPVSKQNSIPSPKQSSQFPRVPERPNGSMNPSAQTVLHAYRHLYRQLLRAVQYSTPARYQARDRMRLAFRDQPESKYDATRIARTLEFLEGATKEAGLEHKILKNLLHVQWERRQLGKFAV